MSVVDTLGMVGEILSWIGLGIGLPLWIVALLVRAGDGRWLPVDVVVVPEGDRILARWFAAGETHERPLTAREFHGADRSMEPRTGFVSEKRPSRLRFEARRPVVHECFVIGFTLTIIGVLSLLLSFLPMIVG
ncbi:hypothetical protein MUN76_10555 [Leucobacter rhizosphaerae]|uniref:Uncharacterized protein n=1 Tax=Leucobacter rhizosphaerae TaxID=2932245 RepID=A0ABY4FT67_9MICO|nr:hypothetical protein [Leucobacter rhizosphaerae]UOQ59493.1 hypothetical protein MUN76_10555 [Leucobacter rhizosphaerae]